MWWDSATGGPSSRSLNWHSFRRRKALEENFHDRLVEKAVNRGDPEDDVHILLMENRPNYPPRLAELMDDLHAVDMYTFIQGTEYVVYHCSWTVKCENSDTAIVTFWII